MGKDKKDWREHAKMEFFDKIKRYLRVNDSDDESYDDDVIEVDEYEDDEDDTDIKNASEQVEEEEPMRPKVASRNTKVNKVIPIRKDMEVTMFRPTSVEESRNVVDSLKEGKTVVLNLEDVRIAVAQRIVDFICGAAYDMEGNLQSISDSIFIVTPSNISLSGEFVDLLGGSGSIDRSSADASGYGMRL